MQTIQDHLARTYANRELNRIDQLRACHEANELGISQGEIARRLVISQPEVSRILKKIRNFPELLERTPREVILDFHAERISHDQMMYELKNWHYTFAADAEPGNPEGALTSGDWDQIVDAVHRDLIDMADYEALLHTVHPTAA
jgi:transcriptional regulator with XRE-family HTH domain